MSMPSSKEEVATSPLRFPALSASSMATRCGWAKEPWCACTKVSPASSLSAAESRSATRRLFTKTRVERWARMSSRSRGWMAVQMEARVVSPPPGGAQGSTGKDSRAMSSTGTSTRSARAFLFPASTTVTLR